MEEQNKTVRRRAFIMAFAVTFLLLALILMALVLYLYPKDAFFKPRSSTITPTSIYIPKEEERLTLLLIGNDGTDAPPGSYMLLHFDPVSGKIPVVVLPPETLVKNGNREETLASVYRFGGSRLVKQAVADTLMIPIDRYARFDLATFSKLVELVGSVDYQVPQALSYKGDGMDIQLNAGLQHLSGDDIANIIRYPVYEGGESERCTKAADLVCSIINQRLNIALSTQIDDIFKTVVNMVDTDVAYIDYETRKDAAEMLTKLSIEPATPIPMEGKYNLDETAFTLSAGTMQTISEIIGHTKPLVNQVH